METNGSGAAILGALWFIASVAVVWTALRRRSRIKALPPTGATIALQLVNGAVLLGGIAMLTVGGYNLLTRFF